MLQNWPAIHLLSIQCIIGIIKFLLKVLSIVLINAIHACTSMCLVLHIWKRLILMLINNLSKIMRDTTWYNHTWIHSIHYSSFISDLLYLYYCFSFAWCINRYFQGHMVVSSKRKTLSYIHRADTYVIVGSKSNDLEFNLWIFVFKNSKSAFKYKLFDYRGVALVLATLKNILFLN